jgi:hypothetical protein
MSRLQSSATRAAGAEGRVPPLTQSTKDGKPYIRRADVEVEIGCALAAGPAAWTGMVAKSVGSEGGLSSEAIVFLLRALRAPGQEAVLEGLVKGLSHRISRIVTSSAQGFDPTTTDEIVSAVNLDVITLIFAETTTRQSEILEIAFRATVKRRALNEVEKRKHYPRAAQFAFPIVDRESPAGDLIHPVETLADAGPSPEEIAIESESRAWAEEQVRKGLTAIRDPRHREAVNLHHLHDWPITAHDPATPSLTTHFNVSDRQIRNWMKSAFTEMRQAMGEKHER